MPECTSESSSYPLEEFLAPGNLDLADTVVVEVFKLMFGYDVSVAEPYEMCLIPPSQDGRTAIVGLSGSMRGSCQISMGTSAARSLAVAMLDMPLTDDDDDSINDALGELCNMLAGGWKNGVQGLSSECTLSPPTVVSGRDYKVYTAKPSVKLSRTYQFATDRFRLMLCREEFVPT